MADSRRDDVVRKVLLVQASGPEFNLQDPGKKDEQGSMLEIPALRKETGRSLGLSEPASIAHLVHSMSQKSLK